MKVKYPLINELLIQRETTVIAESEIKSSSNLLFNTSIWLTV